MQDLIAPVDKEILKQELTQERFVRHVNNGGNQIYLINHHNSPNVMNEIGRLRELTFREAGGGTGLPLDIDENDTCEHSYEQLIVWNPIDEEIIAGYRLIHCQKAGTNEHGEVNLSTAHLFKFSDQFKEEYLPYTIELGRSFVQPKYQPGNDNRKGLFSLDNLWDGLGAMIVLNRDVKYLFGKVTMYPHYHAQARDLLLYFMNHYFPDRENLVTPHHRLSYKGSVAGYEELFQGLNYKEGYKMLNTKIRGWGENIPPLINTYMNLSPSMKNFGTTMNNEFGAVEETGILITIADIYDTKKQRHIETYDRDRYFNKKTEKD